MEKQIKIVISHPSGNANTKAAVKALWSYGLIDTYHTGIACFEGSWQYRFLKNLLPILSRKLYDKDLIEFVKIHPFREIGRGISAKLHLDVLTKSGCGIFDVDTCYHKLDETVAHYLHKKHHRLSAVYAYDEGALISFKEAKKHHLLCIFDLPTIHWRCYQSLLEEERVSNPEWANALGVFDDPMEKLLRKDEELLAADLIIVASEFTKQSILNYFPHHINAPIKVVNYGFPNVAKNRSYQSLHGRKLKCLYVGRLSQAKGLSYMFEAIERIEEKAELTIVGSGNLDACPQLRAHISKHHYIPYLPHNEVLNIMQKHDVLIFPSLFEGYGLVVPEAMSQGTPVIATDKTCASDLVQHGYNSWVVKSRSTEEIYQILDNIICHPELLEVVGKNALLTATSRPWSKYEEELANTIKTFLNGELSKS